MLELPVEFRTPHSAFRILALVIALFAPTTAGAQTDSRPLRKTDLIRLLTDSALSPAQVAAQVGKSCLAFTPTARDRANLVALGADSGVMARIDACARARATAVRPPPPAAPPAQPAPVTPAPVPSPTPVAAPRPVAVPLVSRVQAVAGGTTLVGVALKRGDDPVAGARLVLLGSARVSGGGADAAAVTDARGLAQFRFPAGSRAGTYRLGVMVDGDSLAAPVEVQLTIVAPAPPPAPAAPAAPVPAPERTGFVLGMAQRGRVGEEARLPLVFEVRDSTGHAIPGFAVELSVVNGRVSSAQLTTDSACPRW